MLTLREQDKDSGDWKEDAVYAPGKQKSAHESVEVENGLHRGFVVVAVEKPAADSDIREADQLFQIFGKV